MKITDVFKSREKTFSFEFFPPKDEISAVDFGINVGQLLRLSPSFVSVTYGAGGSSQERTFALVDYLQNKIGLNCMAHYTCIEAPMEKIVQDMNYLQEIGIQNLMLLRGDPPKGHETFVPKEGGFANASDLVKLVAETYDFCIGAASYPEKHPEASSLDEDIKHLKFKVAQGVDFLVTQLFFVNDHYFQFVDRLRAEGIRCRVLPGIIPVTNFRQVERFAKMSGAVIPEELIAEMEPYAYARRCGRPGGRPDFRLARCQYR